MTSLLDALSTISPTSPPRDLPLDLQFHILKFCSPSTLATTSRVSLPFLELSTSLLHRNITIVGYKHLDKLLCPREPSSSHARLSPFLDLDRREIQSFTFTTKPTLLAIISEDFPETFSLDRVPTWNSLRVENLHIRAHPDEQGRLMRLDGVRIERQHSLEFLAPNLFPLFDVHHVQITGISSPINVDQNPEGYVSYLELEKCAPWPNLRSIAFVDSGPAVFLTKSEFALLRGRRPFTVVFDFARRWPIERDPPLEHQRDVLASNMQEVLGGSPVEERRADRSVLAVKVVDGVVLRVRNEEQKEYLWDWIEKTWEEDGIAEKEQRRRGERLSWEIVGWVEEEPQSDADVLSNILNTLGIRL